MPTGTLQRWDTKTISIDVTGAPAGTKLTLTYLDENGDPKVDEKTGESITATVKTKKNNTVDVKLELGGKTADKLTYTLTDDVTGTAVKTTKAVNGDATISTTLTATTAKGSTRNWTLALDEVKKVGLKMTNFDKAIGDVYGTAAGDTVTTGGFTAEVKIEPYSTTGANMVNANSVVYVYVSGDDVKAGAKYVNPTTKAVDENITTLSAQLGGQTVIKIVVPANQTGTVEIDQKNFANVVQIRTTGLNITESENLVKIGDGKNGFVKYNLKGAVTSLSFTDLAGYSIYAHTSANDTEALSAVVFASGSGSAVKDYGTTSGTYSITLAADTKLDLVAVTPVTSKGADLKSGSTTVAAAGAAAAVYVKAGTPLTAAKAKGSTLLDANQSTLQTSATNVYSAGVEADLTVGTSKLDVVSATKVTWDDTVKKVYAYYNNEVADAKSGTEIKAKESYVYGACYIYGTTADARGYKAVVTNTGNSTGKYVAAANYGGVGSGVANTERLVGPTDLSLTTAAMIGGTTGTDYTLKIGTIAVNNGDSVTEGKVLTFAFAEGKVLKYGTKVTVTVDRVAADGTVSQETIELSTAGNGSENPTVNTYTVTATDIQIAYNVTVES